MLNFENGEFCWFPCSLLVQNVLIVLKLHEILQLISAQKIKTIDGHLRLFPAFRAAILDLKVRKRA